MKKPSKKKKPIVKVKKPAKRKVPLRRIKPPYCFLEGVNAVECDDVDEYYDYCNGCMKYVCKAHSLNCEIPFGRHDPMVHVEESEERK